MKMKLVLRKLKVRDQKVNVTRTQDYAVEAVTKVVNLERLSLPSLTS